jgi:hypothetical protein
MYRQTRKRWSSLVQNKTKKRTPKNKHIHKNIDFFTMSSGPIADASIAAFTINDLAAATYVPYNADGSVNYGGVDAHCKDLADNGVMTAFSACRFRRAAVCDGCDFNPNLFHSPSRISVNGTTGDSMCLSEEERKLLSEAWVAAGKKYGVRIFNHIGSQSISEACNLAKHAQETGCVAICAMAPMFFKCASPRVLALWLKEIGAAAPKMPLYYYNFPAITGVGELLRRRDSQKMRATRKRPAQPPRTLLTNTHTRHSPRHQPHASPGAARGRGLPELSRHEVH